MSGRWQKTTQSFGAFWELLVEVWLLLYPPWPLMKHTSQNELFSQLAMFLLNVSGSSQFSSFILLSISLAGSVFLYYCSPLMKSLMARVVSALEVSRVRKLMDLPQLFERASWIVTILSQVAMFFLFCLKKKRSNTVMYSSSEPLF